jgi:hypothetical protein
VLVLFFLSRVYPIKVYLLDEWFDHALGNIALGYITLDYIKPAKSPFDEIV